MRRLAERCWLSSTRILSGNLQGGNSAIVTVRRRLAIAEKPVVKAP